MSNNQDVKEVSLWKAVILQAILDCLTQSKRRENINARKNAIAWLDRNNQSFIAVCHFAALEPDFVIKKVHYALKNQGYWRRRCDIGKGEQFINF